MIIQHNIMALNAHRQLGGNTGMVSKNLEKLSSGYKINRAGDDAAGLAISEKMRAQIKSLDRAKLNAQDGISLVQTAEGALTETHSMLNRLVELATQAANGTITAADRQKITDEVTALKGEINRISEATNFNDIKLLNGEQGSNVKVSTIPAAGDTPASAATVTMDLSALKTEFDRFAGLAGNTYADLNNTDITINGQTVTLNLTAASTFKDVADQLATGANVNGFTGSASADGSTLTFTGANVGVAGTDPNLTAISSNATGTNVTSGAGVFTAGAPAGRGTAKTEIEIREQPKEGGTLKVGNTTFEFVANAADVTNGNTAVVIGANAAATAAALNTAMTNVAGGNFGNTIDANGKITLTAAVGADATKAIAANTGGGLTMQVGDTADPFNKVTVSVDEMSATALGIGDITLGTEEDASASLALIKKAVETVSTARSGLGALQNRLEHTINNLGVTSENMTAAESRIRDVDMAKEMMDFTKNNVLTQAAQAMLAQANQQPQQVLQLLR